MVALCVSHRIQRWVPLTAANAADGRWVLGVATGLRVTGQDDTPSFVRVPQLSDDDVQQIVETTAGRVVRLLQRRSVLEEGNVDPLWEDEPLLATITAASVQGQVATGERADNECAGGCWIRKKGCALARCALPRGGSPSAACPRRMQLPVLRPPIVSGWSSCAATSFVHPWPPGVCEFRSAAEQEVKSGGAPRASEIVSDTAESSARQD